MSEAAPIIGRSELIEIVGHRVKDIPAKIDTGADSCAIWASNIREHNQTLSFTLFDAGSVFFTGKEMSTDRYKVTSVKNSFGEKELRYTVWLPVRLHNRRFKIRFNLADRSNNRFPILLGKRFLNNKFLVDVSKSYLLSAHKKGAQKNILVLAVRVDDKAGTFFSKVAAKLNAKLSVAHYDDLVFTLGKNPSITLASTGQDVSDFSLVYFKSHKRFAEQAAAAAAYLRYKNIVYRDEEIEKSVSRSKLSEMMILSAHGLPVPDTVVASTETLLTQADELIKQLGSPLVCKDVHSDRGENNFLLSSTKDLKKVLKSAPDTCLFAVQQYIPNDGFYRLFVLGQEIAMAIKRSPVANKVAHKQHLNKPRGGSNAELVDLQLLESGAKSIALRGAEVMNRQIAGTDVMQDKTHGKWYILEVNASPQLYGPTFSDEKAQALAKYLNTELERW